MNAFHNCFRLYFQIVCFTICYLQSAGETIAYERSFMPKLDDLDMIELYYLRSFPFQAVMSSAGTFKLQTSGLALRSTLTQQKIVLEFKPLNLSACFLPLIDENEGLGENATLLWDKRTTITYDTEIDTKYWQQSTFLGTMNAIAYRRYLRWLEDYQQSFRSFIPQSICSKADEQSCFTISSTGDTFLAARYVLFYLFYRRNKF